MTRNVILEGRIVRVNRDLTGLACRVVAWSEGGGGQPATNPCIATDTPDGGQVIAFDHPELSRHEGRWDGPLEGGCGSLVGAREHRGRDEKSKRNACQQTQASTPPVTHLEHPPPWADDVNH